MPPGASVGSAGGEPRAHTSDPACPSAEHPSGAARVPLSEGIRGPFGGSWRLRAVALGGGGRLAWLIQSWESDAGSWWPRELRNPTQRCQRPTHQHTPPAPLRRTPPPHPLPTPPPVSHLTRSRTSEREACLGGGGGTSSTMWWGGGSELGLESAVCGLGLSWRSAARPRGGCLGARVGGGSAWTGCAKALA